MAKVNSNSNAQGQGIFKALKGMFVEEGLIDASRKSVAQSALTKNTEKTDEVFKVVDYLKNKDKMDIPNNPAKQLEDLSEVAGDMDLNSVDGMNKKTAIMKTIKETNGLPSNDDTVLYNKKLRNTKIQNETKAAGKIAYDYFANPVKRGVSAYKEGDKSAMASAFGSAAVRVGAPIGAGLGLSAMVGNNTISYQDEKPRY